MKAPLPQRLSSSYCDDYEGTEEESGWLLSLLGENVEGSFNSSPLLAQWRRVHITENPMVSVFSHNPYLCVLCVGIGWKEGCSLGGAQVGAAGTVIGMRTVVSPDSVWERGP